MSSNPDDLEFNTFYQALQTRFLPQYEHAQQHCWLVCIPKVSSLEGCSITRQFVDMHLLQPSLYYRDQYTSVVNGQKLEWEVVGNTLQCISNSGVSLSVQVLAEELAYNKSLRQFKMFIIERPLNPNYKPLTTPVQNSSPLKQRRRFEEHRQLLQSFYNYSEVLRELDTKIASFIQNYLIVEVESLLKADTAQKLETIVKQISTSFLEANRRDVRLQDRRIQEAVWLSIESYLMSSVHSKVYPAICRVHKIEDTQFTDRCRNLKGRLTPSFVGLSKDYSCPYTKTLSHLNKMELCHSPLERLYCLQDATESVICDVKDHFTRTLRHGEPVLLASDDLIALLATIIVQSDCAQVISSLYYMENFHWSLSDADKLSYVLVTFRATVEYIRGSELESLLPMGAVKATSSGKETLFPPSLTPREKSPVSQALNESMASLAKGQKSGGNRQKEAGGKKSELGPFLSLLMDDDTVSSSTFYTEDA